ncbi:ABC transporter permease [Histidinibacterium lentulum]|uniref:ABC transporter permease n=1 Tax=Histidinibacterium lentulum TaxID=2480588 RepID=A0A3N2QR90_9RHOB|nr:ABC transporter permease [Histidinibacterium lentulum]ROT97699.1 ABC transporter permease [Histidinibacterium lentulum]
MTGYLLRRALGFVLVLWMVTVIVFALQAIIPADPARAITGPAAPAETVERVRGQLGLNDPIPQQYVRFLGNLARGDLGTSVRTRQPVADDLRRYLPATLELVGAAMILGTALALVLALAQMLLARSGAVRMTMLAAGSVPIFLSAMLLIYLFWFSLDWLPGAGRIGIRRFEGPTGSMVIDGILLGRPDVVGSALAHLVLPALALALPLAVAVGRSLASALHDVLRQPYAETARGKGLPEYRVVLRHGLRNAASPPLSMLGLQLGLMFGNLLIVERTFAWPGLGLYMVQSLASSDLPAVLGVALTFGAVYILFNMAVEIVQTLADPRMKL